MVATIRRARDEFLTTGSKESFNAMANGCVRLQSILERNKDKFDSFSALSCDAGLISEHTDHLRELSTNLARLSAACVVNREYYGLNNVEAYVAKGRSCLNLAKLPYAFEQPIRALLDKVERENSEETSNFTRSLGLASPARYACMGCPFFGHINRFARILCCYGRGVCQQPVANSP